MPGCYTAPGKWKTVSERLLHKWKAWLPPAFGNWLSDSPPEETESYRRLPTQSCEAASCFQSLWPCLHCHWESSYLTWALEMASRLVFPLRSQYVSSPAFFYSKENKWSWLINFSAWKPLFYPTAHRIKSKRPSVTCKFWSLLIPSPATSLRAPAIELLNVQQICQVPVAVKSFHKWPESFFSPLILRESQLSVQIQLKCSYVCKPFPTLLRKLSFSLQWFHCT